MNSGNLVVKRNDEVIPKSESILNQACLDQALDKANQYINDNAEKLEQGYDELTGKH